MNAKQAHPFRALLEEACDAHIKDGGRIISGVFGYDETVCPIACLLNGTGSPVADFINLVQKEMNYTMSTDEVWAFITSFDGLNIHEEYEQYVFAILIGKALREKYILQRHSSGVNTNG